VSGRHATTRHDDAPHLPGERVRMQHAVILPPADFQAWRDAALAGAEAGDPVGRTRRLDLDGEGCDCGLTGTGMECCDGCSGDAP
jgi:hypothetical protein